MSVDINKILDESRALGCSDLHFTVGIPPIVRQGGNLRKLSSYPDMTEIDILKICEDMCTDKQRQSIKDHIDTDFTFVSSRGFRHRVRNTLSASPVLPFLTSSISTNIHIYGFNQMGISF